LLNGLPIIASRAISFHSFGNPKTCFMTESSTSLAVHLALFVSAVESSQNSMQLQTIVFN
jgi:hypothetical protein